MKKHKIPKAIKTALAQGKQRRKNYKIFDILRDEDLNSPWYAAAGLNRGAGLYYAPYIPVMTSQSYGRALRSPPGAIKITNFA